ncbi:MAG: potassium-transporting ATPase subunit KdpC [Solidesulfovibrio sp. DCME]|uniref:potassium-transporting ATPase subunit KdpC n=1 Tax=Solidesulfovibrio sp. DCME TaxID=3447380 RepID=UPI003D0A8B07
MLARFLEQAKPALLVLVVLTLLTGVVYPACVTGLAQALFPNQANGSLLSKDGRIVGSALIGQPFADPAHFQGRPSATAPRPYDAAASSGSNLGPTNPDYLETVAERAAALRRENGPGPVPVELATASASGLDPHLSPAAAFYQVPRVAKAAGLEPEAVRALVARHVEGRQWGILGEERVNVLALNLALDALAANKHN